MGALSEGGLLFEQQQQHAEQHPQWSFNVQCVTFLGHLVIQSCSLTFDMRPNTISSETFMFKCVINACDNSDFPINLRHAAKTLQHMYYICLNVK